MKDYYKILNISSSATFEEIKSAFNVLALKLHPDKGGTNELFREIHEAYYALKDSNRRRAYDEMRTHAEPDTSIFLSGFDQDFQSEYPELIKTLKAFGSRMFDPYFKYNETSLSEWYDFYIIGNPIVVKNPVEHFTPEEAKSFLRSEISQEELERAFPSSGTALLFLNEMDALQYALSISRQTVYENTEYAISPIFKVNYLGDKQELKSCYTRVSYEQVSPISGGRDNTLSRIRHSIADVAKLVLLSGVLKVNYLGVSKEYPRVEFKAALAAGTQENLKLGF